MSELEDTVARLSAEHPGKFFAFSANHEMYDGPYDTFDDAAKAGGEKYGGRPFTVRQV